MSAAEGTSKVNRPEQIARYLHLDSWLLWPTVRWVAMESRVGVEVEVLLEFLLWYSIPPMDPPQRSPPRKWK